MIMNISKKILTILIIVSSIPALGIDNCNQTLGVVGDFGDGGADEGAVAKLIKSWNVDAVITTGDNNYESGSAKTIDKNIGKFYSSYIYPYSGKYKGPSAGPNRFFPSLGNHDWDDGPNPYLKYFTLPNNERYYDVVLGGAHFFIINSNEGEPDGIDANSVQAKWLKTHLSQSTAPFKIVVFHHPPYTSTSDHGPEVIMRWPFKQWGATTVLTGHNHFYERLESGGFTYFVNGAGGHGLYPINKVAKESKLRVEEQFGAQKIVVTCKKMSIQFFDIQNKLRDQVDFTAP